MPSKTLLIGLDGAEPELLFKWAEQGLLPTIKTILDDWYHRPIDKASGFGDGVFWTTLITGVGVGKHGRYFPEQYNPDTYELDAFSIDTDLGRDPFWYYCSKAGAKVACIDLYTAPLRSGLNGIQIADWMTHSANDPPRSWPPSLINTISEQHMSDPLGGKCESGERNEQEYLDLHANILDRLHAKTNACNELLDHNDWDIFSVGYCDPHDIGHLSWHWHDTNSPVHPTEWRQRHGDPLLHIYQALDNSIAKLTDSAQAQNIYLVAGLGMGLQSTFNSIIQRVLGHYCGRQGSRKELTEQRTQMPYFEIPHNMSAAAVRINLTGRDAQGVVKQEDYDDHCNELCEKLMLLQDAETGQPIVEEVLKVHELHPGKHTYRLPDLFVVWKKQRLTKFVRVDSDTVFEIEQEFGPEYRVGDHSDRALFASNIHYDNQRVQLEAIAPTLCRTIGINLPQTDAEALTPG